MHFQKQLWMPKLQINGHVESISNAGGSTSTTSTIAIAMAIERERCRRFQHCCIYRMVDHSFRKRKIKTWFISIAIERERERLGPFIAKYVNGPSLSFWSFL
jgi:hypothetical protein